MDTIQDLKQKICSCLLWILLASQIGQFFLPLTEFHNTWYRRYTNLGLSSSNSFISHNRYQHGGHENLIYGCVMMQTDLGPICNSQRSLLQNVSQQNSRCMQTKSIFGVILYFSILLHCIVQ
jgi:hypothetical protein